MYFRVILPVLLGAMALVAPGLCRAQTAGGPPRIDPGLISRSIDNHQLNNEKTSDFALIQAKADNAPSGSGEILAGAIRVEGVDRLPSDEIMAVIAPFIAHRLSPRDIQDLLAAVAGIARAHGYIFASSEIPSQTVTAGVLTVRVDLGRIDRVRAVGPARLQVYRMLKPLEGRPATRAEIARRLGLAADIPGVAIGRISYANEGGAGVLTIPTSFGRYSGFVQFDNRGLEGLGPERGRIVLAANSAIMSGDSLVAEGLVTPLHPDELGVLAIRYSLQPSSSGTQVAVYGTLGKTHPGGPYAAFDTNGESRTVGISIAQPIMRTENSGAWASVAVERTLVRQWYRGTLGQRDAVTTVNVTLNGYTPFAKGRLQAGAMAVRGLALFDATQSGDPLAGRPGISTDFTKVVMWAQVEAPIAGAISTRIASVAQLASGPLPTVQQLTTGGPNFGRAYSWNERIGDEGALASAELRANIAESRSRPIRSVQFYTFADAGEVHSHGCTAGAGSLYSAGAGLRLDLANRMHFELEAAFPITTQRFDTRNKEPRISFSISKTF